MDPIYQDNHLLAFVKSAGMTTQENGLEALAKQWLKEKTDKKGNVFLHAIHRLDRPVSGIVVFAKTSKALSRMNEMMRQRKIQKYYLALVSGSPKKKEGRLIHTLAHGDRKAFLSSSGKEATLSYRVLEEHFGKSLLLVHLETGRYHQIRCQLASIGCPIVGDQLYGSKVLWQKGGIALHHLMFLCPHPVTKEPLQLIASTPPLGWDPWCYPFFSADSGSKSGMGGIVFNNSSSASNSPMT